MRESFILYTSQYKSIQRLTLEQKGRLLDAIFHHALGETIDVEDDRELAMAFSFIEERLSYDCTKYDKIVEKRREAGRKGGLQRVASQANATFAKQSQANATFAKQSQANQANQADTDTDTDTDTVTDTEPTNVGKEKPSKEGKKKNATKSVQRRFVKPTVEEVEAYCRERGNYVDAEHFCDFYEAKGWKIGSQTMKDWKATVRTWEKRDGRAPKKTPGGITLGVDEWIDERGDRRYGTGQYTVPMSAPPRPGRDCYWSPASNQWVSGV